MIIEDVPTDVDDAVGVPFAGEGLEKMILLVGLSLSNVHITHLVKCHSPESRRPTKAEIDACRAFLDAQIDLVRPRVIVALGVVVTQTLANATRFLEARGRWYEYRGIPVMPTHHPSHLYRNADLRRGSQRDMQLVAAKLGRKAR
jgi:DNA polymerase